MTLRHLFISYRLAKTNDENLTAVEAGNSPAMIRQSYRQIKDHTGRVITPELPDAFNPEKQTISCRWFLRLKGCCGLRSRFVLTQIGVLPMFPWHANESPDR